MVQNPKLYGALYLSKSTIKPTDIETVSSLELTNEVYNNLILVVVFDIK